ncbi:hypothetical protein [Hymenobacter weizhouensis]|uniref:hypothetical protein n=1 Tax=Hymenobacter sp. YIM 151500-1 TaxID=2987689 RepID=UPI002225C894|nr:hypothetical protein [Hymenobacter sp. YIM 151500-1]UYZ64294.1 hypothetical protein OIS53_05450 [Hymenobacter sp. YIM 151500-1]
MNRELIIDATQVSLGDSSVLTLELIVEGSEEKLAAEIGKHKAIRLVFDSLRPDAPSLEYVWGYGTAENGRRLIPPQEEPAENSAMFADITYPKDEVVLADKQSLTLTWTVHAWEELGSYLVRGFFVAKDSDRRDEEPIPTNEQFLDFGPVKVRVLEEATTPPVKVTMQEARRESSPDQALWVLIRNRTVNFSRYRTFIDKVMCAQDADSVKMRQDARNQYLPFSRVASYTLLKYATEAFLMQETGLAIDRNSTFEQDLDGVAGNLNKNRPRELPGRRASNAGRLAGARIDVGALRNDYLDQLSTEDGNAQVLPYFKLIREKLSEVPLKSSSELNGNGCYGILKSRLQAPPLMELIWSYWHEEGGLVQTMNAISLRFQNVRRPGPGPDPLANLNLDPLRPLSNLIWGFIEDERFRQTINRRNQEYKYEYGYSLKGRAVQDIPAAEHRSNFQRGFHSLLRTTMEFYQQANFTTVIPDGFPILNHLREVHLTLAEGAHNQYGDLPWAARAEMLTQQWLLARPEMREFLGGRIMVPYAEPWMDRVDNMKTLQGWNSTNISHFRDLGVFGEQLLLSIRYGSWNDPNVGAVNAANWAHYWREEIQRYIHAYQAVTGVDIASDIVDARVNIPSNEDRYLQPAELIDRQVALQQTQNRRSQNRLAGGPLANGLGQARPAAVPVPRYNGNGYEE